MGRKGYGRDQIHRAVLILLARIVRVTRICPVVEPNMYVSSKGVAMFYGCWPDWLFPRYLKERSTRCSEFVTTTFAHAPGLPWGPPG